jgi:hypothetical protein
VRAFTVPVAKPTGRRRHRFRRVVLLTTAVAATFASALALADARLEPETAAFPALATSDVDGSPLTSPAAASPRRLLTAPATPPVAPGSARRFVWAPVEGASGYHIELFRRNSLVFAANTIPPEVTVPAKWKFRGSEHRWEAVAYRWYVWSIVSGKRTTRAVVQARLVVRDR